MDPRRESGYILKQIERRGEKLGEEVLWYEYDEVNSTDHPVYSEGGVTRFRRVVPVPCIWVIQEEGQEGMRDYGAKPTQMFRAAISFPQAVQSGMTSPHETEARLADVLYYDGRWFMVSAISTRGRLRADQILYVEATQIHVTEEWAFDQLPYTETVTPELVTPWDEDYSSYVSTFSKGV